MKVSSINSFLQTTTAINSGHSTINKKISNQPVSSVINKNFTPVNFYGISKDMHSFQEFKKAAKMSGLCSLDDLIANIKPENFIGKGANSKVYKFINPLLDKWVLKECKVPFAQECKLLFEPSQDAFYGYNMGQEIAKAGNKYIVLKKIEGIEHSIPNWTDKITHAGEITTEEARQFVNSLSKIQEFPQAAFDQYASDLKMLQDKGYKQDSINPNNLLIDYDKKIIHIIDFTKADHSKQVNSRMDLIMPLLDFSLFKNFHDKLNSEEQKQLIDYSKTIIEKCNKASKKANLSQSEGTFLKYIELVDSAFGWFLKDKGGDYRTRYDNMKSILNKQLK